MWKMLVQSVAAAAINDYTEPKNVRPKTFVNSMFYSFAVFLSCPPNPAHRWQPHWRGRLPSGADAVACIPRSSALGTKRGVDVSRKNKDQCESYRCTREWERGEFQQN